MRRGRPGDLQCGAQHRVGHGCLLRADLDAAALRHGLRDPAQPGRSGTRAGAEGEVREIDRDPDLSGRGREDADQLEVLLDHLVGLGRLVDAFSEQVDADPEPLCEEIGDGDQRVLA